MEEELNTDKYFLVDADEFFWSGIDGFNEIEGTGDYREAITFDTLDEAKRFKKTLKENWGEDFNIVKIHFEFIE
jgi:hypothetical protein